MIYMVSIGFVARKPVYGVADQVIPKPAPPPLSYRDKLEIEILLLASLDIYFTISE